MVSGPETQQHVINQVTKEKIKLAIHPEYPKQTIAIGSTLTEEGRTELCGLLRHNLDIFAWKPADMTGVPRHIVEHRLNIREGCLPVRQKKRGQVPERNKAIYEELENVCGFQGLEQSMPQRWLSATENRLEGRIPLRVSFQMFPGRIHRIPSNEKWKRKIKKRQHSLQAKKYFVTQKCVSDSKNVKETYQRLVDKAFHKQIGRNLEVYVDDLVIKSRTEREIIRDIEETFKTLREINMKLNPKKCTFWVREGRFLGYKVNADGLKVCPDKVEDVLSFLSPKYLKDVQRLNEKLASLNRFLSKSAEKSLPFFKTLKRCTKKSDFQWTAEAEMTFEQMKKLIAELPMLTHPKKKKDGLIILLCPAAKEASVQSSPNEFLQKGMGNKYPSTSSAVHYKTRTSDKEQILADSLWSVGKMGTPRYPMEDKGNFKILWVLFHSTDHHA
ncbi:reverse transcriptase domain-containing protein [Tanacetum coccineum]